jgi:transposase
MIGSIYTRHLSYGLSNNKIKQLTSEQIAKNHPENTAQAVPATLDAMNCIKNEIKQIKSALLVISKTKF